MKWLDQIPTSLLLIAAVFLGLAPFVPEPHALEKIKMLLDGRLSRPIDIFDLFFHAAPLLLIGSSVRVAPIVAWDGEPIGDGRPGPVSRALLELVDEDMRSGDRLIDVPYDS